MKESALSLANFIVGKAHEEGADIESLLIDAWNFLVLTEEEEERLAEEREEEEW